MSWLAAILGSRDSSSERSCFVESGQYQEKPFLVFLIDLLKTLQLETAKEGNFSSICLQKMEEYGLPKTTLANPARDFTLEPLTRNEFSFALYQLLEILIPLGDYLDE